jgi:hypothetical protein
LITLRETLRTERDLLRGRQCDRAVLTGERNGGADLQRSLVSLREARAALHEVDRRIGRVRAGQIRVAQNVERLC